MTSDKLARLVRDLGILPHDVKFDVLVDGLHDAWHVRTWRCADGRVPTRIVWGYVSSRFLVLLDKSAFVEELATMLKGIAAEWAPLPTFRIGTRHPRRLQPARGQGINPI